MPEIDKEIGRSGAGGGLLKTGQLTQYGGYQDDGYFKKGLSKLYTILTTGRYSGTTAIVLNAKTDTHSNNCVYDQRTKLMWSRYVAASLGPASDGKLPWTTNGSGEGIFDYAAAANAALLAGYSDWRIPNPIELISLATREPPDAKPDPTAFPTWPATTTTWSSSTATNAAVNAYPVSFAYGRIDTQDKGDNCYVVLVRGG